MKTTMIINDEVLIKAKLKCIKNKTNISKVINEYLKQWSEQEEVETPKPRPKQEKVQPQNQFSFSTPPQKQETFTPNKWLLDYVEDE